MHFLKKFLKETLHFSGQNYESVVIMTWNNESVVI